jgi:hypothetical protein
MRLLILIALALPALAQVRFPGVTIYPSSNDVSTGQLQFLTRRSDGNSIQIQAPTTGSSYTLTLPTAAPVANGLCIKGTTAGQLSFGACGTADYLVTDYGAVCDATTDDTAAIQAAIDAAEAANGGTIVLPTGACAATTLEVSGNFIGFRGQGRSMSTLLGTGSAALIEVDTTAADVNAFEIRDMTVVGNSGASTVGVHVIGGNDFLRSRFSNVLFAQFRRVIYLANTGLALAFSFTENICDTTTVSGGTCIDAIAATGALSQINNNMFANGPNGAAIYFHGDMGDTVINSNHSELGDYFFRADCGGSCTYGERIVSNDNKIDNTPFPFALNNISSSTFTGNRYGGGVTDPVVFSGSSVGNVYDANAGNGVVYGYPYGVGLNAFSSGMIRAGKIDENISQTTYGLSLKDDTGPVAMAVGQELARSAGLLWVRNATPANAYAVLYTFGSDNPLLVQASRISLETDGAARWEVSTTGMFQPAADNTLDIGLTGTRPREVFGHFADFAPAGGTTNYTNVRLLKILDSGGGTAFWTQRTNATSVTSNWTLGDNGGSRAIQAVRQEASAAANYIRFFGELRPALRAIADGDAVDDSAMPAIGNTSARVSAIWGDAATITNAVTAGTVSAATITATTAFNPGLDGVGVVGGSSLRFSKFWGYDLSVTGTVQLGSSSTVGQVWTASDTAGNGSWATPTSNPWTTIGSDIYRNSKVGIGAAITPVLALHVVGTQGAPATSGTTPTGTARFVTGNSVMDVGSRSNGNTWMQVYDATDLSIEYSLELNPNGGAVTTGGALTVTGALDVSGAVKLSNGAGNLKVLTSDGVGNATWQDTGPCATCVVTGSSNQSIAGTKTFTGVLTGTGGGSITGGNTTVEGIRFAAHSTHTVGTNSVRASNVFTGALSANGSVQFESGGTTIIRSGNTFTIEAGSPGSGKVLTSDGVGNATWQTASAGVTSIATSSPISGGTITSTGTISCPTCFTTGGGSISGNVLPGSDVTYNLGSSSFSWNNAYLDFIYLGAGTLAPNGNFGATTTLTCGTGLAVKNITVSGGIVTAVSCGTP